MQSEANCYREVFPHLHRSNEREGGPKRGGIAAERALKPQTANSNSVGQASIIESRTSPHFEISRKSSFFKQRRRRTTRPGRSTRLPAHLRRGTTSCAWPPFATKVAPYNNRWGYATSARFAIYAAHGRVRGPRSRHPRSLSNGFVQHPSHFKLCIFIIHYGEKRGGRYRQQCSSSSAVFLVEAVLPPTHVSKENMHSSL